MRYHPMRLIIAALTFAVGVTAASIWAVKYRRPPSPQAEEPASPPLTSREGDLIIKSGGWLVPDMSSCRISKSRHQARYPGVPPGVFVTGYDRCELLIPEEQFDGSVDPVRKVRVYDGVVFDAGGRTFCYRVTIQRIGDPNEKGSLVGVVSYLTRYDLDGDGTLESWDVKDVISTPLRVPQWVH